MFLLGHFIGKQAAFGFESHLLEGQQAAKESQLVIFFDVYLGKRKSLKGQWRQKNLKEK